MSAEFDFQLFSDGGGQRGGTAAGAAIVEDVRSGARVHLVGFLGGGTNNEGEIIGALLGLAVIQNLREESSAAGGTVRWICDSEYALKSGTEYIHNWLRNGWKTAAKDPVKNQGLWKSYLELSKGLAMKPKHVRGHTGHVENELCDSASTWIQERGQELFEGSSEGQRVEIGDDSWFAVDVSGLMAGVRDGENSDFSTSLRNLVLGRGTAEPNKNYHRNKVRKLLNEAQQICHTGAFEEASAMVLSLDELLKKL